MCEAEAAHVTHRTTVITYIISKSLTSEYSVISETDFFVSALAGATVYVYVETYSMTSIR